MLWVLSCDQTSQTVGYSLIDLKWPGTDMCHNKWYRCNLASMKIVDLSTILLNYSRHEAFKTAVEIKVKSDNCAHGLDRNISYTILRFSWICLNIWITYTYTYIFELNMSYIVSTLFLSTNELKILTILDIWMGIQHAASFEHRPPAHHLRNPLKGSTWSWCLSVSIVRVWSCCRRDANLPHHCRRWTVQK